MAQDSGTLATAQDDTTDPDQQADLHMAVEAAVRHGWSVIPLLGGEDIGSGKRPALRWRAYTRRRPSGAELAGWFGQEGRSAYGIVCGAVSRLAVLDLDDAAIAARFLRAFPHLLETFTVRSGRRGTPHLYWRVDFPVQSRQMPGADLQAEGKYVVGPGSIIGGHRWTISCDLPPRPLSQDELAAVLAWFTKPAAPGKARQAERRSSAARSAGDYRAIYRAEVAASGQRNNSLFAVACAVRDAGYPQTWAVEALADPHAAEPSPGGQREPYTRRLAEAARTIASAYSRPPRPSNDEADPGEAVSRLPNALREALLHSEDGTATLRTLEGLFLTGLYPGDIFSEKEVVQRLNGVVGRYSILKALANHLVFAVIPPASPPKDAANADPEEPAVQQKPAFLLPGQNQTKCRIVRQYRCPDPAALCAYLGITPRGGDPIRLADLTGAKTYRMALQREFIRRRPGRYYQGLLAARLGVSDRTLRRYHADIPIHSLPQYESMPVFWSNLSRLPSVDETRRLDLDLGGQFLEDERGKRYPLRQEIARKLLGQGHRVTYQRQTANLYFYAPAWPEAVSPGQGPPGEVALPRSGGAGEVGGAAVRPLPGFAQGHNAPPEAARSAADLVPGTKRQDLARRPREAARPDYTQPLRDTQAEHFAQRLYRDVEELSQGNARQLVDRYGQPTVRRILKRMQRMAAVGKVRRPAGFLITACRAEHVAQEGRALVPPFEPLPPGKGQSAYVQPQDDPLWQSEAYQAWRQAFLEGEEELSY